jgi:hypothetical protein
MILHIEAVPNSSVIAKEISRYPNITIDVDVMLNRDRYHFKFLGPSGRRAAVLDLSQEAVEDLGGKNNEERMAQLRREIRKTVSRMQ